MKATLVRRSTPSDAERLAAAERQRAALADEIAAISLAIHRAEEALRRQQTRHALIAVAWARHRSLSRRREQVPATVGRAEAVAAVPAVAPSAHPMSGVVRPVRVPFEGGRAAGEDDRPARRAAGR